MKKKLLVLPLIFSLCSCNALKSNETIMKEKFTDIISYIENKDLNSIYNMFSISIRESVLNLKDKISTLFDYYHGTTEYINIQTVNMSGTKEYGTYTKKNLQSSSSVIYTSEARYHINFNYYVANDENSDMLGFQYIYFEEFIGIKEQKNTNYDKNGLIIYEED